MLYWRIAYGTKRQKRAEKLLLRWNVESFPTMDSSISCANSRDDAWGHEVRLPIETESDLSPWWLYTSFQSRLSKKWIFPERKATRYEKSRCHLRNNANTGQWRMPIIQSEWKDKFFLRWALKVMTQSNLWRNWNNSRKTKHHCYMYNVAWEADWRTSFFSR